MKINYTIVQQFIACLLLISLCLQSCGGGFDNHSLIPTREEQIASIETNIQAILPRADIQPLTGQVLTAQGGHTVTLYEQGGELKADLIVNAPQGFSKTYEGAEVLLEQEAELSDLPRLGQQAQQRRIHFQLGQGGTPARIIIYKDAGLMGGMLEGEEEEIGDEVIPDECFCPITQEIMEDPVIAQDGHTYERQAIKRWLDMGKRISPKTGARLLSTELTPNHTMRSLIQDLKGQVPVLARHQLDMRNIEIVLRLREEEIEERLIQKENLVEKESQARLNLEVELERETALFGVMEQQIQTLEEQVNTSRLREKELEERLNEKEYLLEEENQECLRLREELQQKTALIDIMEEQIKALEWQAYSFIERDNKMRGIMLQMQQCIEQPQLISFFSRPSSSSISIPDQHKDLIEGELINQKKAYLYLEHQNLDSNDIIFLINHPIFKTNCKTYKKVSLKRNKIGAEGAIELAKHLQGTSIRTLELGGNGIGAEGAIELVRHLQGTSIHTLGLFLNNIGAEGTMELAKHLQGTSIRTLNVGANGISYRIQQLLKEQYPHIQWMF